MEEITILGTLVQGDFTSPDWARKYEDAIIMVGAEAEKADKAERGSDGLRIQCDAVSRAFRTLFGAKQAEKILGKSPSLMVCLDAFIELAGIYDTQITPMVAEKAKKVRGILAMRK